MHTKNKRESKCNSWTRSIKIHLQNEKLPTRIRIFSYTKYSAGKRNSADRTMSMCLKLRKRKTGNRLTAEGGV